MHQINNFPTIDSHISWFEHAARLDTAVLICGWTTVIALFFLCIKQYYIQRNWFNPPPWRILACLLALSSVDFGFIFVALVNYQYELTTLFLSIHTFVFLVGAGIAIRYFVVLGNSQNDIKESLTDAHFALSEHREQLESIISRRTQVLRQEIIEARRTQRELIKIAKNHQDELNFAHDMQSALLTQAPQLSFVTTGLFYNPAEAISGDTYSIVHNEESIRILLADAMGHGVAAALLTQVVLTVSQEQTIDASADYVFKKINSLLSRHATGGFLTASWLKLDCSGTLEFCGAGNTPLIIWRKQTGEVEMLDGAGQALGMFDDIFTPYEPQENKLQNGDRIFLFTDGLMEWANTEKEFFGLDRINKTIKDCANDEVNVAVAGLQSTAWEFANMRDCLDDVTIIAMEYTGSS